MTIPKTKNNEQHIKIRPTSSWGVLGPSWPPKNLQMRGQKTLIFLVCSMFSRSEASWGDLRSTSPSWPSWNRLGIVLDASWSHLGTILERVVVVLGRLAAVLWPPWPPKNILRSIKNRFKHRYNIDLKSIKKINIKSMFLMVLGGLNKEFPC